MSAALIPLIYVAAVLQSALGPRWEIAGAAPNLLIVVALVWLTVSLNRHALAIVAAIGLVSDLNSPGPMGMDMALFAMAGYTALWLRQRLMIDHFPGRLSVIWLAATFITLLEGIVLRFMAASPLALRLVFERSLLVGLYTMAVAIPVLMVIGWKNDRGANVVVDRG
jgi:rod shape-determining protein MreD